MGVERIEEYKQQNGHDILKVILKPTKAFPNGGYFYADAENLYWVECYTWWLSKDNRVITRPRHKQREDFIWGFDYEEKSAGHKKELFVNQIWDCWYGYYIDYINGVSIDNTYENLAQVTKPGLNIPSKGCCYNRRYKVFQSRIVQDSLIYFDGRYDTELEGIAAICEMRKKYFPDYDYNFLLDRRRDLELLELERTGRISAEEAVYRHVMKYAGNAWYYYRYDLQGYFREHHIPIPEYALDTEGFMVDKVTGQRLCPFEQRGCSHA